MKALTFHQPYASLMGIKINETRKWNTSYRGKVAIHAGKKNLCESPFQTIYLFGDEGLIKEEVDILMPIITNGHSLPVGAIVMYADLVYCKKMINAFTDEIPREKSSATMIAIADQTRLELKLGDWTEGRYAWGFENFQKCDTPIPYKGAQGLWNYNP